MSDDIRHLLYYYWSVPLKEWVNRLIWKGYHPNYYLSVGQGFVKDIQPHRGRKCAIIYFHGTNGNVYNSVQRLSRLDMDIYYIEYPGYSEQSRYMTISSMTFRDQIKDTVDEILNDIPTNLPIILYCRSIGSGVLFECMDMFKYSHHNIKGIIMETPFKSLQSAVSMYIPGGFASAFCYMTGWKLEVQSYIENNIKWFRENKIKFMFITGKHDNITPYKHAEDIYELLIHENISAVFHCYELYGHNIPLDEFAETLGLWVAKCILN
jgi:pimeloyl-ACP methyl ester carboxylesterase